MTVLETEHGDRPLVSVTSALSTETILTPAVLERVNEENSELTHDRVFFQRGSDPNLGTFLVQDIVPGFSIELSNFPTAQNLFTMMEMVIGRGRITPAQVVERLRGRYLLDPLLLTMNGAPSRSSWSRRSDRG